MKQRNYSLHNIHLLLRLSQYTVQAISSCACQAKEKLLSQITHQGQYAGRASAAFVLLSETCPGSSLLGTQPHGIVIASCSMKQEQKWMEPAPAGSPINPFISPHKSATASIPSWLSTPPTPRSPFLALPLWELLGMPYALLTSMPVILGKD